MTKEELDKLSPTEVKAMIYDELVKVEVAQANIKVLNQLLTEKLQPKKVDEVPGNGE